MNEGYRVARCEPLTDGFVAPGYEHVDSVFKEVATTFGTGGGAFCAYVGGREVAYLWGGQRVPGQLWQEDTVATIFSATKGMTALCALILSDKGQLDIDAPVAEYWPEFGQNGKKDALVRQVLTHTVGVLGIADPASVLDWNGDGWGDLDVIAERLATAAPAWEPGTKTAYHCLTYGWIVGELVRRITGRTIGQFFHDEVAIPLGLKAWIGSPPAEYRASLAVVSASAYANRTGKAAQVAEVMRNPDTLFGSSFIAMNGESVLDHLELVDGDLSPGQGGADIRSLARVYQMLVREGELGGVRIASPESVRRFATPQVRLEAPWDELGLSGMDLYGPSAWALGFSANNGSPGESPMYFGPATAAFGHGGAGGQCGFCDPDNGIAVGFARSFLEAERWDAAATLIDALYACKN